ncbi:MAG: GSCFA domain-containing protein [Rikenellaceae bacterium]|nr:GSCFA domain-containing protein [Rikenellaceae bacterium]
MEFTTKTEVYTGERIALGEAGFSIGSCFAENIAGKLALAGFDVASNPFGVRYNPASIAATLDILAEGRVFGPGDIVKNGSLWCSPLFHGSFSGTDSGKVLEVMNRAVSVGREALGRASFVLISLGTPGLYTVSGEFARREGSVREGDVVANCHKFPADYYRRRRMTVGEIVSAFGRLSKGVLKGKKVIYTVSPVRYIKDGLHGSNLGKAILHLAVEEICAENPGSYYFPAYEILTDQLRDYRFYAPDMIHPSPTAIDFIWDRFRRQALEPGAGEAALEIENLSRAMQHRAAAPDAVEYRQHLRAMLKKTADTGRKYPAADLSRQREYFSSQLERCEIPAEGKM